MGFEIYDKLPEGMTNYLRHYGYHFNKKAFEFATSLMRKKVGDKTTKVDRFSKDEVEDLLKKYNVVLENNTMYDAAYVATMCRADFLKSSIVDDMHLALYVKDVQDDVDAPEGYVFNAWYAKMVFSGMPIEWDDLL